MRTPLNIVNLGLTLMEQEVFKYTADLLDQTYRREHYDNRLEMVEKIVDSLMVTDYDDRDDDNDVDDDDDDNVYDDDDDDDDNYSTGTRGSKEQSTRGSLRPHRRQLLQTGEEGDAGQAHEKLSYHSFWWWWWWKHLPPRRDESGPQLRDETSGLDSADTGSAVQLSGRSRCAR